MAFDQGRAHASRAKAGLGKIPLLASSSGDDRATSETRQESCWKVWEAAARRRASRIGIPINRSTHNIHPNIDRCCRTGARHRWEPKEVAQSFRWDVIDQGMCGIAASGSTCQKRQAKVWAGPGKHGHGA